MKGIKVVDWKGYSCKIHGDLASENVVVNRRKSGYVHRKCRICYNELMRRNRKKYNANWRHREEFRAARRAQRKERRVRVIRHYGAHCRCCGLDDINFLSIDHVNSDGAAHRKEIGTNGGQIYLWLEKNGLPDDARLQILCYNCNLGRAFNDGVCPHQGIGE